MTPLLVASKFGNLDCISLLLEREANVRQTDNEEKTAVMLAAEENRVDSLTVSTNIYSVLKINK